MAKTVSDTYDRNSGDRKFRAKHNIPPTVHWLKGHRGFITFNGGAIAIARNERQGSGRPCVARPHPFGFC